MLVVTTVTIIIINYYYYSPQLHHSYPPQVQARCILLYFHFISRHSLHLDYNQFIKCFTCTWNYELFQIGREKVWGSYLLVNEKMVSTQVGEAGNPSIRKLHAFLEDSWERRQKDRLEPDCQELSTLVKGADQGICSIFSRKIFRTLFVLL